jgi:hypothetical protein
MRMPFRFLAAAAVVCSLLNAALAAASRPSMTECLEGSDFIANAARSRDAGMSEEAFLGRMDEDFVAIRAYPNELRWFVHDPDDEAFLRASAREVFDHPGEPERHRNAFLDACVERMPVSSPAQLPSPAVIPPFRRG